MRKHLQYASYVLRHKWFVFVECCRYGMPLRGLLHDASKLLPSEWLPYANFFYGRKVRDATGYYKPTDTGDTAFDFAWLLHQKRNRHHWQWWILREDDGSKLADRARAVLTDGAQDDIEDPCGCQADRDGEWSKPYVHIHRKRLEELSEAMKTEGFKVFEMDLASRKEMLADWRGAGRAQGKPDTLAWYRANRHKMLLGRETRAWVEREIGCAP